MTAIIVWNVRVYKLGCLQYLLVPRHFETSKSPNMVDGTKVCTNYRNKYFACEILLAISTKRELFASHVTNWDRYPFYSKMPLWAVVFWSNFFPSYSHWKWVLLEWTLIFFEGKWTGMFYVRIFEDNGFKTACTVLNIQANSFLCEAARFLPGEPGYLTGTVSW